MAERTRYLLDVTIEPWECGCGVVVDGLMAMEQVDGSPLVRMLCVACAERRIREAADAVPKAPGSTPRRAFGRALRTLREKLGLTMLDLAAALDGGGTVRLSDLERGLERTRWPSGVELSGIVTRLEQAGAPAEKVTSLAMLWSEALFGIAAEPENVALRLGTTPEPNT